MAQGGTASSDLHAVTYMDEVFHVPQAQHYAHVPISSSQMLFYDPMLTTPPGAYLLPSALLRLFLCLHELSPVGELLFLRVVNGAVHASSLIAVFLLGKSSHGLLAGLFLFFLPTNYFFVTLFYTDCTSTFSLVLLWLLYARRRPNFVLLGVVGLWCVTIRQTNICWVFFVAMHYIFLGDTPSTTDKVTSTTDKVNHFIEKLARVSPLGGVGALFISFVLWNGGVVLGDKANHRPVVHGAQLVIFLCFVCWTSPFTSLCSMFQIFASKNKLKPLSFVVGTYFVCVGLLQSTMAHPYILADNRHFTFYFYRRFLATNASSSLRFAFLPLSGCFGASKILSFLDESTTTRKVRLLLLYLLCVVISIVPQKLVEFRYFNPAITLLTLMPLLTPGRNRNQCAAYKLTLWMDIGFCIAINSVTLWVFTMKPFLAPDGSTGRFMW